MSTIAKVVAVMGVIVCFFTIAAGLCFDHGYMATGGALAILAFILLISTYVVAESFGE